MPKKKDIELDVEHDEEDYEEDEEYEDEGELDDEEFDEDEEYEDDDEDEGDEEYEEDDDEDEDEGLFARPTRSRKPRFHRSAFSDRKNARRHPFAYEWDDEDNFGRGSSIAEEDEDLDEMLELIRAGKYRPTSRDPWPARMLYKLMDQGEKHKEVKLQEKAQLMAKIRYLHRGRKLK